MVIFNESGKGKIKRLLLDPSHSKIKTFAILTAENPDAVAYNKEQNKDFNKQLKKMVGFNLNKDTKDDAVYMHSEDGRIYKTDRNLESAVISRHYPYYKIRGHFGGNTEHSFLIYNITLDDAKALSKEFHQQSFIFGKNENGKLVFEFWANKSKSDYVYAIADTKDFFVDATDAKDFYSKISDEFSINIPFEAFGFEDEDMIEFWDRANEKAITESLNAEVIPFERLRKRHSAYKNN